METVGDGESSEKEQENGRRMTPRRRITHFVHILGDVAFSEPAPSGPADLLHLDSNVVASQRRRASFSTV